MAVELYKAPSLEPGRRKFQRAAPLWRFRFRAPGGDVMAVSAKAYTTKQDALEAAMQVFGLGAVTDMSEGACR